MNTTVDYEVEYNNRARVPEHPSLFAGWAKDAAAYREQYPPRSVAYGPGARNVINFFPAMMAARSLSSFMAAIGSRWTVLLLATLREG